MIGQRRTYRVLLAVGVAMIMVGFGSGPASAGGHHRPAPQVVALGDSFSSGEGTFDYRAGTDTATNRCHRSDEAYGAILTRIARSGRLAACSGAVTRDIVAPNHLYAGEPAQLDAVSTRTKLITLGIGGNDLGFSSILAACVKQTRDPDVQCYQDSRILFPVRAALLALAAPPDPTKDPTRPIIPVAELLGDIAAKAPRATILLVGYPHLFGSDLATYTPDPTVRSRFSCALEPTGRIVLDSRDTAWINAVTDQLNLVLATAARQANVAGLRVDFVPASTFDGHGLCDTKQPYLNPLVPAATGFGPETLHPTARGQVAYLEAVLRTLGRRVCGERVSARELRTLARNS